MRWYISATAVREWQAILGWPVVDEGPGFDDAAKLLDGICDEARLVKDEGERQTYRVSATVRDRRLRLELTVSTKPRPEGPLPQLVQVRRR